MTRVSRITLFVVALGIVAPSMASAQLAPFVMGENGRKSFVGFESGFAFFDRDDPGTPEDEDETFALRLDLVGEFRIGRPFKLFARFPVVMATEPDTGVGIGNVTVGGRYLINLSRGEGTVLMFVPQGSVSLPTASDSDEAGFAAATAAFVWAPHDFGWYAPNTTSLRFGGDFSIDTRSFFIHTGLGLHYYMFDGDDDETLLRFGLAMGVKVTPLVAIVGEFSYMSDIEADSLDIGVRWRSGRLILGVRGYIPLDDRRDADMFGVGFDLHALF